MSFKKAIVSSVAAAALATSAFAGTGAIQVAADKTGDYLLFPAYYANSAGWKTDLRVVNTNTTASVVAKVVIRDARQSEEKVDFVIYLTPGDVWSGLIYESAGTIHVSSSDDSLVIGGVPANESPVDLVFPAASNGQVITSGYVEVFGLVQTDDASVAYTKKDGTSGTEDLGDAPVDKRALYQWFTTSLYDSSVAVTEKREVSNNDLTGQAVVYADNTSGQLAMTTPATAMEGLMGTAYPNNAAYIAANIIGKDTLLSNHVIALASQTKYAGGKCDLVDEYESAIAKYASYVVHYGDTTVDESALLALFPTKKYRLQEPDVACTIGEIFEAKTVAEYAWAQSSDFMVTYGQTPRDMMENTPSTPPPGEVSGGDETTIDPDQCDRELCQITVVNSVGAEGYVTYVFTGEAENNSTVVSPMPYETRVMTAKNVGGANVTNMISPAFVGGQY
ncbi:MAG: hypothetical protein JXK05_05160 [Campylobacterales bacterium]|nr:hypothetical protein [Campylobacterales bacterium]